MKTAQEFRIEVYEKRHARLLARKKAKRRALLCVPLVLAVAVSGVFVSRLLESPVLIARESNIPLALQAGKPAAVKQVTPEDLHSLQEQYLSENNLTESALTDEDRDEINRRYSAMQAENQLITPDFHTSLNRFARDSAVLLANDFEENACYSPLSLYYALALAGSGAQGKTEQEFLDVLHAPDTDWLADQCGKYYRQHYSDGEDYKFLLANSLWMDGNRSFEQNFLNGGSNDFYASLFQADFTDPALGEEMAKWVSDNTNGLLSPGFEFADDTVMEIFNTVYFYARWSEQFDKSRNSQEDFHKADGSAVTAEFMHSCAIQPALEGNGFIRASLPLSASFPAGSLYGGGEMIFILPDEGVSPEELLSDPKAFEEMFFPRGQEEYSNCVVEWSVPKFDFDCEYNLADMLQALGLRSAFDVNAADFSGISRETAKADGLYISGVRQGDRIGIDEKGVEAAAYTEVMIADGSGAPEKSVEMKLDRPFLFAIAQYSDTDRLISEKEGYEKAGDSLLFVGVCGDPTAE